MAQSNRFVANNKIVKMMIGATSSVGPGNIDTDAVRTFDYVSLKNYGHVTFIIDVGAGGAASAVTFSQATDVSATSAKALGFTAAYRNVTANGTNDALTAFTVSSDTFSTAVANGLQYVVEFDAEDLDVTNGFDCVTIAMTDPGATTNVNILAILSAPRFPQESLPTAITD
jgi:hypothetical protein